MVGIHCRTIGLGDVEVSVSSASVLLGVDPHVPGAEIGVERLSAARDVVEGHRVDGAAVHLQVVSDRSAAELDVPGQGLGLALKRIGVLPEVLLDPCDGIDPLIVGVEHLCISAVGIERSAVLLGHLLGHDHLVARSLELSRSADSGIEGAGEGFGRGDAIAYLGAVAQDQVVVPADLTVPVLRGKCNSEGLVGLRVRRGGVPGEFHANRVLETCRLPGEFCTVLIGENERLERDLDSSVLGRLRIGRYERSETTQCYQKHACEQSRYMLAMHREVLELHPSSPSRGGVKT